MTIKKILFGTLCLFTLTHCVSYDFSRHIVEQGNLLPLAKVKQLHVGMSKDSVAALMGTSLISPMFNEERWDYSFTERKGSAPLIIRHLTLYFKNNHLARIERAC